VTKQTPGRDNVKGYLTGARVIDQQAFTERGVGDVTNGDVRSRANTAFVCRAAVAPNVFGKRGMAERSEADAIR